MREWANGTYTGARMSETLQLNSEALGRIDAVRQIGELDYHMICGGDQ